MTNVRDNPRAGQRKLLERAFAAAVAAADPGRIPAELLPAPPTGRIVVVGAGKAAVSMAAAVERYYSGSHRLEGLVIAPDTGGRGDGEGGPARIEVARASHPTPDQRGVAATLRLLELVRGCAADDRVVVLLSGGGSALLCAPEGLELEEKVEVTAALLRSGARIEEMNIVRKHLSQVKGGRLALAARPAPVTALVLSDVVGDDLSSVASGPTVGDASTYGEALDVLDRYRIEAPAVRRLLEEGRDGTREETPEPADPRLDHARTHLVGNNQGSLEAAARLLQDAGYPARIVSSTMVGEAREVGRVHAAIARQILEHGQPFTPPCALISGGETTVTVRVTGGRGGRNSEFGLGLALELPVGVPVWALAADTDGRDGSEENAGVFITPGLLRAVDQRTARLALDSNDSYSVFAAADHLLISGPTGTNVNDLRVILIGSPDTRG